MLRNVFSGLVLTLAMTTFAHAMEYSELMSDVAQKFVLPAVHSEIKFNAGDTAAYSLNISSFIKGTMTMTVKSVTQQQLVIDQDMDLGSFGKQSCEETLNPNTGALIKLVCNGQDQTSQQDGKQVIEQEKTDTITVAAGTFKCLYAKVKNTKDNSESEIWLAPNQIPVGGMVKTLAPSQFGQVDVELTSYHAN